MTARDLAIGAALAVLIVGAVVFNVTAAADCKARGGKWEPVFWGSRVWHCAGGRP